jgi:hypothetical protein
MKKMNSLAYEYTAFFEANENGGYTVTVPALPGLVTELFRVASKCLLSAYSRWATYQPAEATWE